MADELKPCPFCGEQPRTIDDDSYGACMVFCIKCDYTPDQCFKKVGELDQAIAVWNTRAAPPPEPSEADPQIATLIDLMRRASAAGLHKTAASLELDIAALRAAKGGNNG